MIAEGNDDPRRPTALVAGGGPAGALAAKVLSDRGFRVVLREAYPYPSEEDDKVEKSKAYVISLIHRGQRALRRCGVDPLLDLDAVVVSEAVVRHNSKTGKARVLKLDSGKCPVVARRRALAASVLRAAERSGAEVRCGWSLQSVDFEKKEATFEERGGSGEEIVRYDLLVGADGVRSRTRTLLSNHLNENGETFGVKTVDDTMEYQVAILPRTWKEILVPERANAPPLDKCPPGSVHAWADKGEGSTALGWPVRDSNDVPADKFLVALIFPGGSHIAQRLVATHSLCCIPRIASMICDQTIDACNLSRAVAITNMVGGERRQCIVLHRLSFLHTLLIAHSRLGEMKQSGFGGYTQALSALFSDWTVESRLDVARLLAEEDNVPSTGGVCVWPQALSHPESGTVLVGDAGHGMWPSLGQGCNAALESVSVLADAIEAVTGSVSSGAGCRGVDFSASSGGEIAKAIAIEYNGLRQEDAMAAVDLTFNGIGGTKVRGAPHSPVMFKVQIALFMLLNKVTAGLVPMPAMFRIMKGDSARYSTLKSAMKVEKYVTYGTVIGLVGGALGLALGLFK
ncbi:hypothetical protein ACHAWF_010976 [Thalassiosira exigua]